ncbi:MAG: hypothetical protein ABSE16_16300 [Verrucomicrobiota bacterium]|jgi:tetratricopeptide (TPR) repeat protein
MKAPDNEQRPPKTGFNLIRKWPFSWQDVFHGLFAPRQIREGWRFLLVELFVALALSVTYFFLVQEYAAGSPNNFTNGWVFTACDVPGFHLGTLGDVWKGRLSGLMLSGWLFDFLVNNNGYEIADYLRLFGLYQAVWLFLLFFVVILALRHSLLINLGIFAGLIYDFTPASGLYFYPWDLPATLFFTLAVLFFARRQLWLMAACACAGCFFKETVLVCAILPLFSHYEKWWKRISIFAGIVFIYMVGKKLLLSQLHLSVAAFSMNNATNVGGLFRPTILLRNLEELFSPTWNHPIFANAGTMVAVLLLCWRRRLLPYMALIVVFLAGQVMYGGFNEFRIFMQLLPLSLILLCERWREYEARRLPEKAESVELPPGGGAATAHMGESSAAWHLRATFPALMPLSLALIVLSSGMAFWQYAVIFEDLRPANRAASGIGRHVVEPRGHVPDLAVENEMLRAGAQRLSIKYEALRTGYTKAELELAGISAGKGQDAEAINCYRQVLEWDTNSITAQSSLAWLLATAANAKLRDGNEAVSLAERACQTVQDQDASLLEILAAAYAEAGRFSDAVATAQKARALAQAHGEADVVAATDRFLDLYRAGHAYHRGSQTGK